jgi:hypothetical protein
VEEREPGWLPRRRQEFLRRCSSRRRPGARSATAAAAMFLPNGVGKRERKASKSDAVLDGARGGAREQGWRWREAMAGDENGEGAGARGGGGAGAGRGREAGVGAGQGRGRRLGFFCTGARFCTNPR